MLSEINFKLGKNNNKLLQITRALSSPQRLQILEILNTSSKTIKELSNILEIPLSSTVMNVNILEECQLIVVQETYTNVGKSKLCSRNIDSVNINLLMQSVHSEESMEFEIPIGNYTSYDITDGLGCGIATKEHTIGIDTNSDSFFNIERYQAEYIWFKEGFISYRIPNKSIPRNISRMRVSFEACSEAPFYRNDWKSDISLYICGKDVGFWTSPGDFGGRRGKNNPKWWPDALTQYGVLTNWEIRQDGTYVNDVKISDVTIKDIDIKKDSFIQLDLGVKKDARYCGGLSLFGKGFGDYNQDIIVTFYWN